MRPFVLSIAGFDPSSGAGITSDCKTFEACGVYGLGVCSAITFQNETEFDGVEWVSAKALKRQVEVLLRQHSVTYCKIGLIENLDVLKMLVDLLTARNIQIVWDPILKASAGFSFHQAFAEDESAAFAQRASLTRIASKLFLMTPNLPEFEQLSLMMRFADTQQWLQLGLEHLLLKGGHQTSADCTDLLYSKNKIFPVEGVRMEGADKHGTGCVLSSAIVARLALGDSLEEACFFGKRYVERFIASNHSLLGSHDFKHKDVLMNTKAQRHEEHSSITVG